MDNNESQELTERARSGDVNAMISLALLYEAGLDRERDFDAACQWWLEAERHESALAKEKLELLQKQGKISRARVVSLRESQQTREAESQQAHQIEAKRRSKKILFVDDEKDIREVTVALLHQQGYQTLQASGADDALKQIMSNPDIAGIITDLKMPGVNGLQFVKTLRKMRLAEAAKIIVLTGHTRKEYLAMGQKLKIDQWLVKPCPASTLMEAVDRLLLGLRKNAETHASAS